MLFAPVTDDPRTGASHVHIVSHMCRRATHIASLEAAEGKDDKEFVTVVNPAVSPDPFVHIRRCVPDKHFLL